MECSEELRHSLDDRHGVSIGTMVIVTKSAENLPSEGAKAGAGLGMALRMGLLAAMWFFPTVEPLCGAFC